MKNVPALKISSLQKKTRIISQGRNPQIDQENRVMINGKIGQEMLDGFKPIKKEKGKRFKATFPIRGRKPLQEHN